MAEGAAPHTHEGPLGQFSCTCCTPDPVPECPPFPDYAAPSWWSWLTGRAEPEQEVSP